MKSNTITSDYHTELDKGTLKKKASCSKGWAWQPEGHPPNATRCGGEGGGGGEFDRQKNMGVAKICHKNDNRARALTQTPNMPMLMKN